MELKVLNTAGKQVGTVELNDAVFAVEYNEALIHQVVVAQLANKRQGTKSALTRTEVRGGGVKPYRQKGTGRARQGSIRSPQFVKGGVVFAPKPRDFRQKLNKFSKRQALLSALSQKIRQDEFIVVDEFKVKEAKTKEVANILKALELNKKTLLVVAEDNKDLLRASRNIADLQVINADLINVYDVVRSNKCVVTKAAAEKIEEANL
ncbi:MAG: 50S ribosomal protein L4 [Faecalibacterium sp.]|nr:50S ribosomal protein L4 [Faecalibacterium sp.]MDY3256113.1 50S ribosomal protein L4 [Eubacteriales bacterium]